MTTLRQRDAIDTPVVVLGGAAAVPWRGLLEGVVRLAASECVPEDTHDLGRIFRRAYLAQHFGVIAADEVKKRAERRARDRVDLTDAQVAIQQEHPDRRLIDEGLELHRTLTEHLLDLPALDGRCARVALRSRSSRNSRLRTVLVRARGRGLHDRLDEG